VVRPVAVCYWFVCLFYHVGSMDKGALPGYDKNMFLCLKTVLEKLKKIWKSIFSKILIFKGVMALFVRHFALKLSYKIKVVPLQCTFSSSCCSPGGRACAVSVKWRSLCLKDIFIYPTVKVGPLSLLSFLRRFIFTRSRLTLSWSENWPCYVDISK